MEAWKKKKAGRSDKRLSRGQKGALRCRLERWPGAKNVQNTILASPTLQPQHHWVGHGRPPTEMLRLHATLRIASGGTAVFGGEGQGGGAERRDWRARQRGCREERPPGHGSGEDYANSAGNTPWLAHEVSFS